MGLGAAILVVGALALFGGGKKNDAVVASTPDASEASATVEASASEISMAPNAQVLASETASVSLNASEAQPNPEGPATGQRVPGVEQAASPIQEAKNVEAPADGEPNGQADPSAHQGVQASSNTDNGEPAMLRREHH